MEHTKETLSALVREMQSVTAYNRGVYILNIEIFLDKYSNKILRAGAFFYILVEAGTAEFVVDCHSYNVGKGDMLLVAPRMSVELMKENDKNEFSGSFRCDNRNEFLPSLKASFVNPEAK